MIALHFQYPRSDRGHCNLERLVRRSCDADAFSILGRIVGTATRDAGRQLDAASGTFSILGRIVGTATTLRRSRRRSRRRLSVSSVGSWALQPTCRRRSRPLPTRLSVSSVGSWALQPSIAADTAVHRYSLSVSSVGSWALQRCVLQSRRYRAVAFQYPRSDRGHCNIAATVAADLHAAFQYPRSDRGHCNSYCRQRIARTSHLSVSSVGSWALQRRWQCSTVAGDRTFSILGRIVGTATPLTPDRRARTDCFQYPRSDRGHCNNCAVHPARYAQLPFSILGRIVGTATCGAWHAMRRIVSLSVSSVGSWALQPDAYSCSASFARRFQYPRSDRGHCNADRDAGAADAQSTFSILGRIVGTATAQWLIGRARGSAFSILGRIVGTATLTSCSCCIARRALSVSSVGSWALQLRSRTLSPMHAADLSVSSVGSWALQLLLRIAVSCDAVAFSILGRIVGTATPTAALRCRTCRRAFSILGRIVGTATCTADSIDDCRLRTFSILGRIVGTATAAAGCRSRSDAELSVSSVGSWALQLDADTLVQRLRVRLSVSSVGSWALQPCTVARRHRLIASFSILGRIVGTATCRKQCAALTLRALSVSSVGSWALQLSLMRTAMP